MTPTKTTGELFEKVQDALSNDKYGKHTVIPCGTHLTIESIGDFAHSLRDALKESDTVIIELNEDVELDITALQTFCSACRTASAAGKSLVYRGPVPSSLLQLAEDIGFKQLDDCTENKPSCFYGLGGTR